MNLIDISVSKHMNLIMELHHGEDSNKVANEGLKILVLILDQIFVEGVE